MFSSTYKHLNNHCFPTQSQEALMFDNLNSQIFIKTPVDNGAQYDMLGVAQNGLISRALSNKKSVHT